MSKINTSDILGNTRAHIQNSHVSNGQYLTSAKRRIIEHSATETNPINMANPYGKRVVFRLKDRKGVINNITLKAKVAALDEDGGSYIRFVDYLGYNFLNQQLGIQIFDISTNTELERILPNQMFQSAMLGLDKEEFEVEKKLVLGDMTDAERNTAGEGSQIFALNLSHYSDVIFNKIPLHVIKSGIEIVMNLAASPQDVISTDGTITDGLLFEQFRLHAEYLDLNPTEKLYIEKRFLDGKYRFKVQRVHQQNFTLASGNSNYKLNVTQNKGVKYCPLMTFVIRESSDLTSSTARDYHSGALLDTFYYEEGGQRVLKDQIDDYEYKNIILHNVRLENLDVVKDSNYYSFVFSHNLPYTMGRHGNSTGMRRNMGGKKFTEENQELTLNFASNLTANHTLTVYTYTEEILRLAPDGHFYFA